MKRMQSILNFFARIFSPRAESRKNKIKALQATNAALLAHIADLEASRRLLDDLFLKNKIKLQDLEQSLEDREDIVAERESQLLVFEQRLKTKHQEHLDSVAAEHARLALLADTSEQNTRDSNDTLEFPPPNAILFTSVSSDDDEDESQSTFHLIKTSMISPQTQWLVSLFRKQPPLQSF